MSDSRAAEGSNVVRDLIIPGILLLLMFTANAALFAYIMYKRKRVVWEDPSIYEACLETQPVVSAPNAEDGAVMLEMKELK